MENSLWRIPVTRILMTKSLDPATFSLTASQAPFWHNPSTSSTRALFPLTPSIIQNNERSKITVRAIIEQAKSGYITGPPFKKNSIMVLPFRLYQADPRAPLGRVFIHDNLASINRLNV